MHKRRSTRSDEIMLIPFLDILCSLIGVLALIIVVFVVAQTQKINGRTPEEIERAQSSLKLNKVLKEYQQINSQLKDKLPTLEKLREQAKASEEKLARLQMLIRNAHDSQQLSQKMLLELDKLLLEISGLASSETSLKKQQEELQAEIKKRQPPAQKDAPVIVQPSGSGFAQGTTVFFVEATADKLTFYWGANTKDVVAAIPAVITADAMYNAFLKAVAAVPSSKLVFLLRDDGWGAYNLGAGWAQATYGFGTERIGKLPIPGRGDIDPRNFKEFLGSLKRPTDAPKN